MQEWYYVKSGQQQGPVSLEQLRDMATAGALLPNDLVWNAEMTDWVPANEVSGIFSPSASTITSTSTIATTAIDASHASTPLEEIPPGSDQLDIGGTFSHTFELTKKFFAVLAIQGLIYFGISMVLAFIPAILQALGGALGESRDQAAMGAGLAMMIISLFLQIIINIATLYLSLGIIRSCFHICEGREPAVNMIFGEGRNLLHAVLASILCFFIIVAGLILLIIPGIWLALRLAFVIPAIVDRNMTCIEAISYSFEITKGNALSIFGLWFLAAILMLAAILLTCGVGAIFATPIFTLGWVVAYRQMKYGRRALEMPAA